MNTRDQLRGTRSALSEKSFVVILADHSNPGMIEEATQKIISKPSLAIWMIEGRKSHGQPRQEKNKQTKTTITGEQGLHHHLELSVKPRTKTRA